MDWVLCNAMPNARDTRLNRRLVDRPRIAEVGSDTEDCQMEAELPLTMTMEEAAIKVGVPPGSLRRAAEKHGYLVKMGRHPRIERRTLEELVEKCRVKPEAHESTDGRTRASTSSETAEDISQRVLATASRLTRPSHPTSCPEADRPARGHRRR